MEGFRTWDEVENSTEYLQADYEEQQSVKDAYFQQVVMLDPEVQTLDRPQFDSLYSSLMLRRPKLKDSYLQAEMDKREQAVKEELLARQTRTGLESAGELALNVVGLKQDPIKSLKDDIMGLRAAKGSFVSMAVDGLQDIFDPVVKQFGGTTLDINSSESEKAAVYMQHILKDNNAASEQELTELRALGSAGNFVFNMAEQVALTATLVGNVGKAGLLTRGIFGEGGRAVQLLSKLPHIPHTLALALGEQTIQATTMAAVQAVQRSAQDVMYDGRWNRSLAQIASDYGQDVAQDYIAWTFMGALSVAGRATFKTFKGGLDFLSKEVRTALESAKEGELEEVIAKAVGAGELPDKAILDSLEPEYRQKIIDNAAHNKAILEVGGQLKVGTPEYVSFIGRISGFDAKLEDGKYVISALDDLDAPPVVFKNSREASDFLMQNAKTGMPKVTTEPSMRAGAMQADDFLLTERMNGRLPMADIDPKRMVNLTSSRGGSLDVDSIEYVARNVLTSGGQNNLVLDSLKIVKDPNWSMNKGTMLSQLENGYLSIPEFIKTAADEKDFQETLFRTLFDFADDARIEPNLKKVFDEITTFNKVNPAHFDSFASIADSLNYASKQLPDGTISIKLKQPGLDGNLMEQAFKNMGEARSFIWKEAISQNKVPLKDLQTLVRQETGLVLQKETGQVNFRGEAETVFTLRNTKGEILTDAGSLEQVLNSNSRLTNAIGNPGYTPEPRFYVIDPESNRISYSKNIVSGTLKQITEFAADYKSVMKQGKTIKSSVAGEIRLSDSKHTYVLSSPSTGITKEFTSLKAAARFLDTEVNSIVTFKNELGLRGFISDVLPDGRVYIHDKVSPVILESQDDMIKFLGEHPIPQDVQELISQSYLSKESLSQMEKVLAEETNLITETRLDARRAKLNKETFTGAVKRGLSGIDKGLQSIIGTSESTFAKYAEQTGDKTLLESYRGITRQIQMLNGANRKWKPVVQTIFDKSSKLERVMWQDLLMMPKDKWTDYAQNFYKHAIDSKDLRVLESSRAAYNVLFKTFNLDMDKFLTQYAPKVRNAVSALAERGEQAPGNLNDLFKTAFGGEIPHDLKQFSENYRTQAFLDGFIEKDAQVAMETFVNSMNKKFYLGSQLGEIEKVLVKLSDTKTNVPKDMITFYKSTITEILGGTTPASKTLERISIDITSAYTDILERGAKKLGLDTTDWFLKERFITGDLLGKLSNNFTLATQAGKTFNPVRNLTQLNLLGAITENRVALESFDQVLKDKEYVRKLLDMGMMSENLFTIGSANFTRSPLIETMMQPLENSEVLLRATCFKTADNLIERSLTRLKSGAINTKEFLLESSLDFTDAPFQQRVSQLISEGKIDTAKLEYGAFLMNSTMFNYNKGSMGLAFRGVPGKLFGKVGTYPASTVDLYSRILKDGNPVKMASRAAKIVLNSMAVYYAFQAVGVDYQGFLWTDPFTFSGGPYWTLMNDMLNCIGDRPENAMARKRIPNSIMGTLVPGTSAAKGMLKGVQYMNEGNNIAGMISFIGATPSESVKLNSMQ